MNKSLYLMTGLSLLSLIPPTTLHAQIAITSKPTLIGVGIVAGTLLDKSGRQDKSEDGTPCNQFGGISALEYSGEGNTFLALGDRGPKDGAVQWDCRFHKIEIDWDVNSKEVSTKILSTIALTDTEGRGFPGDASAFEATANRASRLDPEGIRLMESGNLIVSEEYGPRVLEFAANGKLVKEHAVPKRYQISKPGLTKQEENRNNASGRQGNKGFEGIAMIDGGPWRITVLQSPLIQDCDKMSASDKGVGDKVRMLMANSQSGESKEFVYVLDDQKNVLNEILSIGNGEFLVIERDGEAGTEAQYKRITKININGATDVSKYETIKGKLPADVKPVTKTVFLDLLDADYGLSGEAMPEKIEGLTLGPKSKNGKDTLIIASDNDFEAAIPTYFYVFELN